MAQNKDDFSSDKVLREGPAFTRRQLVKAMGFGAVSTSLVALPERWTRPLVEKVMVPAHAQTSPAPTPTPEPTTTLCAVTYEVFRGELPLQSTDWDNRVISIEQWLPENGPLGRVVITKTATIQGVARVENESTSSEEITVTLAAVMTVVDPNGVSYVQTPTYNQTETFPPFDGDIDFEGDSGRIFDDLNATDTEQIEITEPDRLAVFNGSGFVDFIISAQSDSMASGSGNMTTSFETNAGVELQVEYYCF
jgi:hypothetical protein